MTRRAAVTLISCLNCRNRLIIRQSSAAQMAARLSRIMDGRKVDVLLSAPNLLRLPIHDLAFKEGELL